MVGWPYLCIIDTDSRSQAGTELHELHADSFTSEFAGPDQAAQRAASGNLSRVSSTDTSSSAHASMPGQQAQRPSKGKGQAGKAGRGRGRGQGAASSPSPAPPMAVSHILQAPPRLVPDRIWYTRMVVTANMQTWHTCAAQSQGGHPTFSQANCSCAQKHRRTGCLHAVRVHNLQ